MNENLIGAILVAMLFIGYAFLWWNMRRMCRERFGVDPNVMERSGDPLQRFMFGVTRLLTVGVVLILVSHLLFIGTHPWLERVACLSVRMGLLGGAVLGFGGLLLCALAQRNMGASWRVGIDESRPTTLVTTGVHGLIRNPTYTGLFLVILGMWFVWPTALVTMYSIAFISFFEVQVRCEERDLLARHGDLYLEYLKRTKRYIPWIY
jgi:protein-S-isoprenylcysteine O-methyltransferase Ste14